MRQRLFPPATKQSAVTTGTMMRIEPKSGCRARSMKSESAIRKNGTNPSEKFARTERRFLIKQARKRMSPIFANSTGCTEGNHGISSHHFAPLSSTHTSRTRRRAKKDPANMILTCFSKKKYGIFEKSIRENIPTITWAIFFERQQQLYDSEMSHCDTIREVILNEGQTLTELIMIIPNMTSAMTMKTRVESILFFCITDSV